MHRIEISNSVILTIIRRYNYQAEIGNVFVTSDHLLFSQIIDQITELGIKREKARERRRKKKEAENEK